MRMFSLKHQDRLGATSSIGVQEHLICKKYSVYNDYVYSMWSLVRNFSSYCTFRLAILLLKDRSLDYFAHEFGLGLSTTRSLLLSVLGTAFTDMISPVYIFFNTKFLHTRLAVEGASLLDIGAWKEMNRVIFL